MLFTIEKGHCRRTTEKLSTGLRGGNIVHLTGPVCTVLSKDYASTHHTKFSSLIWFRNVTVYETKNEN